MNKEWRTEYLFLNRTLEGVRRAIGLAEQGKRVMLAAEETYPAADICGRCLYRRSELPEGFFPEECFEQDLMIPDRCKQYLEQRCLEAGVTFCYGLYFVEAEEADGGCRVRLAGKGGVITIFCKQIEREEEKDSFPGRLSLRAWTKDKKTGSLGLTEAFISQKEEKSGAENLLKVRRELVASFQEKRRENPSLVLGRFADKWGGVLAPDREADGNFADVIVAGGGTAGAMAALYAARGGAKTLLLEPMYDLGGTATLGGVNAYWFGTAFEDAKEIDDAVDALCESCGVERPEGMFGKYDAFHGGLKGLVLLELCLKAGVEVRFGRLVYDVLKEKGRITGVKCAGGAGKEVYYGRLIIDATGDGDLAAAAGADLVYGGERDGFTYWGSLAQYTGPDSYQNNFSSMVRLDDQKDFTDFIVTGRRRGEGALFDHGSYVSVRESRHIRGKRVIGLKDVCLFQTYEDGIYTCFSNYDPKGKLDADSVYCGYLVPQVKMQVPLRALLPLDREGNRLEGLYVAGKAISADHNAFPGLRMQRDLMHQGAVLGLLAARAVQTGTDVEQLPMEECRRLIREKTGDPVTLSAERRFESLWEAAEQIGKGERTHWIDVPFSYEEKKVSPLLALVYGEREEALSAVLKRIHALEGELEKGSERERDDREETLFTLKKLALFHGFDGYTEEVEAHICRQLSESRAALPERKGSCMCAQLLPDHGVMPEAVYELNLLSHGKSFSMRPYELVTDRLVSGERDYQTIQKGIFTYMESIAYAGDKSKRKEFIPLLLRLTELPEFEEAFLEENKAALMSQRQQILWVILCRTLFILGSGEGERGLMRALEKGGAAVRIGAEKALLEGAHN